MQNIELVIFDMAGTVVNEDNIVYKTLQNAINKNAAYNVSLDFVLEHGAGKEKHQAIKDILKIEGVLDAKEARDIFTNFKVMLKDAYSALTVSSYPGVEAVIESLKKNNIIVVLNTGYDKHTAQLLLNKMNWTIGEHYDALITADDVTLGRPHPDMILKAMAIFDIEDSTKVLKAGDSIIDIEEGKNASCGITVGVTTGAHTRAQLASADPTYILDTLLELREILIK